MTSFHMGVERNVTKCDGGGRGVKIRHFCVTSFVDGPKSFHLVQLSLHLLMKRDGYPPGSKQGDWLGVPFQFDLIGFSQSF